MVPLRNNNWDLMTFGAEFHLIPLDKENWDLMTGLNSI